MAEEFSVPAEGLERKLAAILAADVAGYSRLMGLDEEGTLWTLKQHRRELLDPTIAAHHGHIVKTTGDGLLVEFASTIDAVNCAVVVQRSMIERNADVSSDRRIEFRIGINVGDILVDDDDVFGDVVNIAARLEGLAPPGGICVSRVVRDHVRDRIQLIFDDHGEQFVKNIERPVRVFGVRLDSGSAPSGTKRAHIVAPASRLSIVVLPFTNLSNDVEQEYFADGIVEDLTTDLSRITGSFVIARNTAFTYKGKPVDAKQLGRDLGVNYMLEGSVRRLGNQVRINVQLIDTQAGGHIWANRFDGEVADLFTLQDSVTSSLAMTLSLELVEAAAQRASQKISPDEVDLVLRGRAAALRPRSRESAEEAKQFYERALSVAPNSAEAKIGLAEVLAGSALSLLSVDREADLTRADELVSIALTQVPNSAWVHYVNGEILRCRRRATEAAAEYHTAIALDRNYVPAIANLAFVKILSGVPDLAIPLLEEAIRRSPRDPLLAIWHSRIGQAEIYLERFDEAKEALERSRSLNPNLAWTHLYLAGLYALLGTAEKAKGALTEAKRLSPDLTSVARYRSISQIGNPDLQALRERTLIRGLRLAGLSEQ